IGSLAAEAKSNCAAVSSAYRCRNRLAVRPYGSRWRHFPESVAVAPGLGGRAYDRRGIRGVHPGELGRGSIGPDCARARASITSIADHVVGSGGILWWSGGLGIE